MFTVVTKITIRLESEWVASVAPLAPLLAAEKSAALAAVPAVALGWYLFQLHAQRTAHILF